MPICNNKFLAPQQVPSTKSKELSPLLERVEALPLVDLPGPQSNTQLDLLQNP